MKTTLFALMALFYFTPFSVYAECCTKTGTKGSCTCCCDGTPVCDGDGTGCVCSCLESRTGLLSMAVKGMTGKEFGRTKIGSTILPRILDPKTLNKLRNSSTPLNFNLNKQPKRKISATIQKQLAKPSLQPLRKPSLKTPTSKQPSLQKPSGTRPGISDPKK